VTESDFMEGVAAVMEVYPGARLLPPDGNIRPLRIEPVPLPEEFWGGGSTRLLVVYDLVAHTDTRPRGLLGPEWTLPGGGAPLNASPVFEFGEAWQAFSWSFPWPPALSVMETIEAYLGRFSDHR
jgi:hypothetical protein